MDNKNTYSFATTIIPCPKCNQSCVVGTTIVTINHPLTGEKEVHPTYTCPSHGGTYMISGHFVVDVDAIPE